MKKAILILAITVLLIGCFIFAASAKEADHQIPVEPKITCATAGHHGSWQVEVNATCTTTGLKVQYCMRCGEESYQTIPATGHSVSVSYSVSPTCTNYGYNVYKCNNSGCSHSYTMNNGKSPYGHTGNWEVEVKVTCTTDGRKVQHCTRCGEDSYQTVHATGHSYKTTTIDPTCTAQGYTLKTCSNSGCNYSSKSNNKDALGHDGSWVTTAKATCAKDGLQVYECMRCEYESYQTIPATGHTYKTTTIAPTCTEQGYTLKTCTNSGCSFSSKSNYKAALGHNVVEEVSESEEEECWVYITTTQKCTRCKEVLDRSTSSVRRHTAGNWITEQSATCTTGGKEVKRCTGCGFIMETRNTSAIGHSYQTTTIAPTCTEQGYTLKTCINSGCSYSTKTNYTAALGHNEVEEVSETQEEECWVYITKIKKCTRCGTVLDRSTSSVRRHTAGNWITEQSATCTAGGKEVKRCTGCGFIMETRNTSAIGHSYQTTTIAPTCTEQGYTLKTCTNSGCNDSNKSNYTAALGHNVVEEVSESLEEECWVYITTTKKCTRCGEVLDRSTTSVRRHVAGEWITEEATCEGPGRIVRYCTGCHVIMDETILPRKDHEEGETTKTPATCETDGSIDTRCANCNALMYSTKIPALGHDEVEEVSESLEEECWVYITTTKKCTRCGEVLDRSTTSVRRHVAGEWITEEATCEGPGRIVRYCTGCHVIMDETILPRKDHEEGETTKTPATCETDGSIDTRCANCNALMYSTKIPALGHDVVEEVSESLEEECWVYITKINKCTRCEEVFDHSTSSIRRHTPGNWIKTSATCTSSGEIVRYCDGCHFLIEKVVLPRLFHEEGNTIVIPATCETAGRRDTRCANCNALMFSSKIPAPGHKIVEQTIGINQNGMDVVFFHCENCIEMDEIKYIKHEHHFEEDGIVESVEVTCTEDGYIKGYCSKCERLCMVTLPKTGHTIDTNRSYSHKEPTCSEDGYIDAYCATCKEHYREILSKENVEHVIDEMLVAQKAPTCVEDGYRRGYCDVCDELVTVVISKLDSDHVLDESKKIVSEKASCTKPGYREGYCKYCGEWFREEIAIKSHDKLEDNVEILELVQAVSCYGDEICKIYCNDCNKTISNVVTKSKEAVRADHFAIWGIYTESGTVEFACLTCKEKFNGEFTFTVGQAELNQYIGDGVTLEEYLSLVGYNIQWAFYNELAYYQGQCAIPSMYKVTTGGNDFYILDYEIQVGYDNHAEGEIIGANGEKYTITTAKPVAKYKLVLWNDNGVLTSIAAPSEIEIEVEIRHIDANGIEIVEYRNIVVTSHDYMDVEDHLPEYVSFQKKWGWPAPYPDTHRGEVVITNDMIMDALEKSDYSYRCEQWDSFNENYIVDADGNYYRVNGYTEDMYTTGLEGYEATESDDNVVVVDLGNVEWRNPTEDPDIGGEEDDDESDLLPQNFNDKDYICENK